MNTSGRLPERTGCILSPHRPRGDILERVGELARGCIDRVRVSWDRGLARHEDRFPVQIVDYVSLSGVLFGAGCSGLGARRPSGPVPDTVASETFGGLRDRPAAQLFGERLRWIAKGSG